MTDFRRLRFFLTLCGLLILFESASVLCEEKESEPEFILSRRQAHQLLEKSSYRWQQTFSPINEADAKEGQAESANKIHVSGFSREFIMRTNELILGISDSGPLNVIGGGITGVQASYELFSASSTARLEAARANKKLGRATTAQLQNDLHFLLLLRYLDAQQYQMKIKVAEVMLNKDLELKKMAEQKVKSGFGIPLDQTRVEALVEKDNFKKLEAQSNFEKATREMRDLVPGLPVKIKVEDLSYVQLPKSEIDILSKKITERPELKVADLSLEAMRLLKKSTDNEVTPSVQVFAEAGTLGTQALGLINSPTGSIGMQLNIPLYSGGYNAAKSAEALSKLNSIEWQQHQVKLETENRLETAKAQLGFTEQVVQSTQRQVELAKKASGLAQKKVQIGSAGNLELLNAQNDLATAMDMNVQALFANEAAKLQFFHLISDADNYLKLYDKGSSQ